MNESEFVIKEKELLEGEVSVGLAVTPQEMIGRLDVVTDRYIREGYLQGIPFARIDLEAEEVVQENGLGLLYESLEPKLFDKFERLTAEKEEGTGLGLPIIRDIVKLHRGKIRVESKLGKGSRFIVILPRHTPSEPGAARRAGETG